MRFASTVLQLHFSCFSFFFFVAASLLSLLRCWAADSDPATNEALTIRDPRHRPCRTFAQGRNTTNSPRRSRSRRYSSFSENTSACVAGTDTHLHYEQNTINKCLSYTPIDASVAQAYSLNGQVRSRVAPTLNEGEAQAQEEREQAKSREEGWRRQGIGSTMRSGFGVCELFGRRPAACV